MFLGRLTMTFKARLNLKPKICLVLSLWVCPYDKSAPNEVRSAKFGPKMHLSTRTWSHHEPWNSLLSYLGETIGVQPASTGRLALDFTRRYRFSPYYIRFTCRHFICKHSSTTETTVKPPSLAFIAFCFQYWESSSSFTSAIFFSAINTYVTQHRIVCFTSLTRFRSVSSPNVVSGVWGRNYWYQLFKATIRHRTSETHTCLWPIQLLIDDFCLPYASKCGSTLCIILFTMVRKNLTYP